MRLVFKVLVVAVVVFGIGNYLVYLKTGQMPIVDLRDRWGSDWFVDLKEKYSPDQLTGQAKKAINDLTRDESAPPAPAKVYKWTDANGQVHYGDQPDAPGAQQMDVKIQNAISPADHSRPEATAPAQHTPVEKARAAADAITTRAQQQEAN